MIKYLRPFGSVSDTRLRRFEEEYNLVLPDDYREFLRCNNGGQLNAVVCHIKRMSDDVLVEVLLGIDQSERSLNIESWLERYSQEMPAGFTIIGLGSTGLFILGTFEPDVGVYFWDDEHAFSGSSGESGNTYPISSSFTGFLELIRPM